MLKKIGALQNQLYLVIFAMSLFLCKNGAVAPVVIIHLPLQQPLTIGISTEIRYISRLIQPYR
ncbi:hypothetical protein F220043C3_04540 [Enterocloster asparagiformis]